MKMKLGALVGLLGLLAPVLEAAPSPDRGKAQERKNRPFLMGATPMPHDLSLDGITAVYAFLNSSCDLVSVKIDEGVPWVEALDRSPYTAEFEASLKDKGVRAEDQKFLLSVTPLNQAKEGLAEYRGKREHEPKPDPWRTRDFDDPKTVLAYLNYCREMIQRFRPDYFCYAIEPNLLIKNQARWKKFLAFSSDVYTLLKKENPSLPIFATLNLENFLENASPQKKALQQLLVHSDLVSVIALPFLKEAVPSKIPKDYFQQAASLAPGKPFAVAETAYLAEDLSLYGVERAGKQAWQQEYLKFVLEESAKLGARFVVWMIPRDYDELWNKFGALAPEFLRIFKNTGLKDGQGHPRKSYETWMQWYRLPRKA
jgi:hypothetical protein